MKKSLLIVACLLLSSCTQMHVVSHVLKKTKVDPGAGPACGKRQEGHLKVGRPYTSHGVRYTPKKSSLGYKETGIASWYGADFHGRTTANGECYDMYALTAAHRELPLPTTVKVTNPENGRSVILRVNDRGPYSKGRIIDLSYAAARQLGLAKAGVGPVVVEAIGGPHHRAGGYKGSTKGVKTVNDAPRLSKRKLRDENYDPKPTTAQKIAVKNGSAKNLGSSKSGASKSDSFTNRTTVKSTPKKPVNTAQKPSENYSLTRSSVRNDIQDKNNLAAEDANVIVPNPATVPTTSKKVLSNTKLFVQVGAFGNKANAQKLAQNIANQQNYSVRLKPLQRPSGTLYRVQAGPFNSIAAADAALAKLAKAGFNTANIAVD